MRVFTPLLSFSFSPPPGQKVNGQPSSITSLRGGGIRRSITFTMTAGLNGTKVVCSASDVRTNLFVQSRRATILGQEVPNLNGKFPICSLSDRLFFNWNSVCIGRHCNTIQNNCQQSE